MTDIVCTGTILRGEGLRSEGAFVPRLSAPQGAPAKYPGEAPQGNRCKAHLSKAGVHDILQEAGRETNTGKCVEKFNLRSRNAKFHLLHFDASNHKASMHL